MFQAVVNAVPIGVLIVIVVGLVVGFTLLGVWLVRRAVPLTAEGFDAEVSSQMLGVVASMFGLVLAFVVVLAFQGYDDAGASVNDATDRYAARAVTLAAMPSFRRLATVSVARARS